MSNSSNLNSYLKIWKVSYPIILSGVAQNIVNVTDTAFLSQLGIIEIGAAGNAGILYFVFVMIGMGFTIGAQIIMARRNGEQNHHLIGNVFHQAFWFLIFFCLFSFVFMQNIAPIVLEKLTASTAIFSASMDYLNIRSYGIGFAYMSFLCIAFFTGITETKVLIRVTFIQALVNVVLDYLLIFGLYGFPEMGIKGAALASLISELCALIYYVIAISKYVKTNKYGLLSNVKFDLVQIKQNLIVGSPIMLQHFLAITTWLSFFMIIEQVGEFELAISHIIRSIYMVLMIPLFGFSSATSTLVSNLIGQNNAELVGQLIKKITLLCLLACAVFIPFNFIFPEFFISIYTSDQAMINSAIPVLHIISLAMLFFSIAYISFSGVIGTGKTNITLIVEISSISVYLISGYYLAIVKQSSLSQIWCSEFVYFSVMGGISLLYLKFGNWKSAKV